ncbi:MAG TPA: DUF2177 domain-containing protein [Clostridiales bacterium]|nr:DUF2177 domain-containing protein [Clostridiales bacterium]
MAQFGKIYLITLIVFFIVDLIWLGLIAKNIYSNNIGHLMSEKVNWLAAGLFYVFYILGLVYFAVHPALQGEGLSYALRMGAIFGFFTYMTYDLTNLATLKDWPLKVTLIDIAWGTFLGGSVSTVSYFLNKLIK